MRLFRPPSQTSEVLENLRGLVIPSSKISPGQQSLWDDWEAPAEEIRQVAEKFILANCFDPKFVSQQIFNLQTSEVFKTSEV